MLGHDQVCSAERASEGKHRDFVEEERRKLQDLPSLIKRPGTGCLPFPNIGFQIK